MLGRDMNKDLETDVENDKEWLLTNGIGGYASLSLDGSLTRKYQGWLIASLPPPLGRVNMCSYLDDSLRIADRSEIFFSFPELLQPLSRQQFPVAKVALKAGQPVWTYAYDGYEVAKSAFFIHKQNSIIVTYELLKGNSPAELIFRPYFNFKHYEAPVNGPYQECYCQMIENGCKIITELYPPLYILGKTKWNAEEKFLKNVIYRIESERGYDSMGDLKSMGYFSEKIGVGDSISFIISTEPIDVLKALSIEESKQAEYERRKALVLKAQNETPEFKDEDPLSNLILAADQFIIISPRKPDVAWTDATGIGEAHTIIAGYHWFTDWGRDSMISLEGLTLVTGRFQEAKEILHLFAHHVKDGLIPNMFPDGQDQGVYYTADATLWFIHALKRYLDYTQDFPFLEILLPKVQEIVDAHLKGTKFGIHMDPKDGLLKQGQEGYALTWMDAKVGDLVVTPRRGKAVEINGLWYNALRIIISWYEYFGRKEEATYLQGIAEQCYRSFNQKFWFEGGGYLYDVIEGEEGDDPACRANQIFTFSLDYPVLEEKYWKPVIEVTRQELLTPFGLRTLSSQHPNYKINYNGSLLLRDLAYHQGTIWAWLIGPFIDAWLRVYPDKYKKAEEFLKSFTQHLNEAGLGTVNEIFDSGSPHMHRGCIAQAWSVAEILRIRAKLLKCSKERDEA